VIDPHAQTLLQDILRRESRSILMYVAEAYPWTTSTEEKALVDLQQIIAAERQAVADLGQFLVRRRVPLPFLPSFPSSFTTINFIALDYLLPRVIEHERQSIAALERDLVALKEPAARAEVEKLLAVKRLHLPRLSGIRSQETEIKGQESGVSNQITVS
jgi:hypothetical protein